MDVSWPSVVLGMANPAQSGIESGLGLNLPISVLGHLDLVDKVPQFGMMIYGSLPKSQTMGRLSCD